MRPIPTYTQLATFEFLPIALAHVTTCAEALTFLPIARQHAVCDNEGAIEELSMLLLARRNALDRDQWLSDFFLPVFKPARGLAGAHIYRAVCRVAAAAPEPWTKTACSKIGEAVSSAMFGTPAAPPRAPPAAPLHIVVERGELSVAQTPAEIAAECSLPRLVRLTLRHGWCPRRLLGAAAAGGIVDLVAALVGKGCRDESSWPDNVWKAGVNFINTEIAPTGLFPGELGALSGAPALPSLLPSSRPIMAHCRALGGLPPDPCLTDTLCRPPWWPSTSNSGFSAAYNAARAGAVWALGPSTGALPLAAAAAVGAVDAVSRLLELGADPLGRSVAPGRVRGVEYADCGVAPAPGVWVGAAALAAGDKYGSERARQCFELIVRAAEAAGSFTPTLATEALFSAVTGHASTSVIETLINHAGNAALRPRDGQTLVTAAIMGRSSALGVLLRHLPTLREAPSAQGVTPLGLAAAQGWGAGARELLDAGAGVNTRMSEELTALHLAAENDATEVVAQLVEAGALVDAVDAIGATPLARAVFNGANRTVILLLTAGANPLHKITSERGMTPLHVAAGCGNVPATAALLKAGGLRAFTATDAGGATPLETADTCRQGATAEVLRAWWSQNKA